MRVPRIGRTDGRRIDRPDIILRCPLHGDGRRMSIPAVPDRQLECRREDVTVNRTLWAVQALVALIFLFAGGSKLVMPLEAMQQGPVQLPGWFLRSLGVAEVLGALGIVLPGLLGIRPGLTPLAAAGLVVIMIGAVTVTLMGGDVLLALIPLVVGSLAVFIVYGRSRLAPHPGRANSARTLDESQLRRRTS
jgi:hypothetical protein